MITIVPKSLSAFNIPALGEARDLVQPLSQIGKLPISEHVKFFCADEMLNKPNVLAVLEQAADEGYAIALVVGGGRELAERRAAATWAFVPTTKLNKVSVDDLLEEGKWEQKMTTSHSAPVIPTRQGFERFKGRPNSAPSLRMIQPNQLHDEPMTQGADGDEQED